MESQWTKAEFNGFAQLQGTSADLVKLANESLAKELAGSLAAFLRIPITSTYSGGEVPFKEFYTAGRPCCYAMALVRPGPRKVMLALDYSVLFTLVGTALGAKAGNFPLPDRAPTEIELQVVSLLFRMILAEADRAWMNLIRSPLETVSLEFEPAPAKALPASEAVFAANFRVTAGDQTGDLSLVVPPDLFAKVLNEEGEASKTDSAESTRSSETILDMMLPAKVSVDVWLDGSEMRLGDLLQLREGQVVKLDHPVERKATCTLNGRTGFAGQIVSTGQRRAFLVEISAEPVAKP